MQNIIRTHRVPFWNDSMVPYSIEQLDPQFATSPLELIKSVRRYKQEWWGHHSNGNMAVAYALLHYLSMDAPGKFDSISVTELHGKIVEKDKAKGRIYAEGATLLAACEVASDEGWLPNNQFFWATTGLGAINYLHKVGPLLVSSRWFKSLYDRDDHSRCTIRPDSPEVGGLIYCVSGVFPKSGLVRIAQTWGDGYYFMPFQDFSLLVGQEGEVALLRGLPTT